MKNKGNIQWVLVLGASFAWFGQHCGSGFCSGLQTVTYFGNAGYLSLITSAIPFIILGFVFYLMGEYARKIKAASYKDVALTLYSENKYIARGMLTLWDVIILANVLISGGAVLAGAATLLNEMLGINYLVASIMFALITAAICMFGAKGLTRSSLPLVGVMIILICIVSGVLIYENWAHLTTIVKKRETFGTSTGTAVRNMIFYTGLQSGFMGAYMAIAPKFQKKSESVVMSVTGGIVNGFMLMFCCIAILSCMPGASESELPIYGIITERFGQSSVLSIIYQAGLFLAYVTTAVGNVFGATSRFGAWINKKQKYRQSSVDGFISILLLLIAVLIAQFGLSALVDKGYKVLSLLRGPVYIGGAILVPYRLYRMKKKEVVLENEENA